MAKEGRATFRTYDNSTSVIYLQKKLADDSEFPFEPEDELVAHVDGDQLVIRKTQDGHRLAPADQAQEK